MSMAAAVPGRAGFRITAPLLAVSDAIAAILLAADLIVVCVSVLARFWFNAPVEWSDDVARGLQEVVDAGAEMILLNPLGADVAEDREQMERLAADVLHRVTDAARP